MRKSDQHHSIHTFLALIPALIPHSSRPSGRRARTRAASRGARGPERSGGARGQAQARPPGARMRPGRGGERMSFSFYLPPTLHFWSLHSGIVADSRLAASRPDYSVTSTGAEGDQWPLEEDAHSGLALALTEPTKQTTDPTPPSSSELTREPPVFAILLYLHNTLLLRIVANCFPVCLNGPSVYSSWHVCLWKARSRSG